ncbi:hypothetical protein O6H91_07G078400 [Diphasiastrum complanatum]|uniref:Uncharacterized protein n=1 Tax=Diphasiastrum complanatum TaxID=34168 RepID=A0ACC2D731_DIPCM|nr:hypothetical protein O6H91_07G078400 [Diphasiastrum complanatum]
MIGVRSLLRPPHLIQALLAVPKRHSNGARRIRFTASAGSAGVASDSESAHKRNVAELEIACPVCLQPLSSSGVTSLSPTLAAGSTFHCTTCQKQYKSNNGIFDLTISAPDYEDIVPFGVSFFQNPLIAFAYDRGYRDLFQILNFPGPDEEEMLVPAHGQFIMDLSCGSGLFTKRFLASEEYNLVIGADYSEAMLEQCLGFLENETRKYMMNVVLMRADAGRLPFLTSSLAAVHAGAAIHCWPQPLTAVAEIARVLRPGGVFVASTYILPAPPFPLKSFYGLAGQIIAQAGLPFRLWSEEDLRALVLSCGFVNWTSTRRGIYVLFSATKPS